MKRKLNTFSVTFIPKRIKGPPQRPVIVYGLNSEYFDSFLGVVECCQALQLSRSAVIRSLKKLNYTARNFYIRYADDDSPPPPNWRLLHPRTIRKVPDDKKGNRITPVA